MVENQAVLTDTAQIDKTEFFEAAPAIEPAEAFEPAAAENAEIITVEVPEEESLPEKSIPDNIRAFMEYEDQGMTVQQIASITRRNKGEVLLLKNLSKHYRK
ncbi:MAG TPA: hypothetical protein VK861_08605, partial [Bacteroidales bacterium]|nr:hypothetical protein [Bacteroidales bacterium]